MWHANKLLLIVLCLTKLTFEVNTRGPGSPLSTILEESDEHIPATEETTEDVAADETRPMMRYKLDSNGDVILPTVQTPEVAI